jgi:hypothetical protein
LAALLGKGEFLFFTVIGLRFSSDKETAKCKKMRIPAVLERLPVQISQQYL